MNFIAHRGLWTDPSEQNSFPAMRQAFEAGYDVETDLRACQGRLWLTHDPIESPDGLLSAEALFQLLCEFPERRAFVNIKEDGLLKYLNPLLSKIERLNLVFFDMSVPELIAYSRRFSSSQLCTRFSEFESRPAALELCDWIWMDAFAKDLDPALLSIFSKQHGKSLALVSPELHRRNPDSFWQRLRLVAHEENLTVSLCTDSPAYARSFFGGTPVEPKVQYDQSHSI